MSVVLTTEARGAWACSWAGTRPSEESASVSAQTVFANAAMVVSDAATFYTTGRGECRDDA